MNNAIYDEIERLAKSERRPDETLEQAITRIATERPDLAQRYRAATVAKQSQPEPEPVLKAAMRRQGYDKVMELARAERRRHPGLSEAQAVAKAMESPQGAEAYEQYSHPYDPMAGVRVEKARLDIETAALRLMASDPSLSHPEAVVKAVEANPDLYEVYREAHDAASR